MCDSPQSAFHLPSHTHICMDRPTSCQQPVFTTPLSLSGHPSVQAPGGVQPHLVMTTPGVSYSVTCAAPSVNAPKCESCVVLVRADTADTCPQPSRNRNIAA